MENKRRQREILNAGKTLSWRVNTPGLLNEILLNQSVAILNRPLEIFAAILAEVGERAAEINDPKLNALMCRLSIYSLSDPYNPEYDEKKCNEIIEVFY